MAHAVGPAPIIGVAVLVLLAAASPGAQDLPALTQPVNDHAGVIDPASGAELDRRIRALQAATSDVVVVATVQTIAPSASIEEYAVRLFEQSRIGTRAQDNGLLILLAVDERRVRVEVGYGLEEFVTDGFAGEVIRRDMLPEFRAGRYGPGLLAGATQIIHRIAERRGVALDSLPAPEPRTPPAAAPRIPFGLIVLILIWLLMSRRGPPRGRHRRHRGPWSGWSGGLGGFGAGMLGGLGGSRGGFGGGFGGRRGGGFGGFGGFGGGRSGGGGASGGW